MKVRRTPPLLLDLPEDVLLRVLLCVSPRDLCALERSCRHLWTRRQFATNTRRAAAAGAEELHGSVAFHVDHLHVRIGGPQSPQLPAGTPAHAHTDAAAQEWCTSHACHKAFWRAVWTHKAARGATEVTATPEYGPFPYQQVGGDLELWEQTVAAGELVCAAFAEWQAEQHGVA